MVDVYVSPSVQHFNLGYNGYGSEEERMNMVADVLEYELNRHGLTTARNDPSMTLPEVVNDSNAIRPKVHVALHSNASTDGLARGAEVYTHRFNTLSDELSQSIYKYLSALTPTSDLGVKEGRLTYGGQGMRELRDTKSPASLIEVAFHDNKEDAQFVIDNVYEIGREISKGVLEYFGIKYNPDSMENMDYLKNKYNGKYLT